MLIVRLIIIFIKPLYKNDTVLHFTVSPLIGTDFNMDWTVPGIRADYHFDGLIKDLLKKLDLWAGIDSKFAFHLNHYDGINKKFKKSF